MSKEAEEFFRQKTIENAKPRMKKFLALIDREEEGKIMQEYADQQLRLYRVSQPRELLIDFYSKQNGGMNETNKYAIIREVDKYIESVEVGKAISELSEIADKEAEKFIEKYTTKDQNDWLVKKKDIIARFMESYHNEQLRIANVSKSLPTEDAKFIYSLLPDWVKSKAPEGLYPTMYGTLSKEGVDEIQERVKQILGNVC